MRPLRCLLGRHDWTSPPPDGAAAHFDEHRATCARCGAGVTLDAHRERRPPVRHSALDDGWPKDPDRPWSW